MNSQENCRERTARRRLIRERAHEAGTNEPNGIDYVEVDSSQRLLIVYFLNKAPHEIVARNVRVEGGVRVRGIRVTDISLCELDADDRDDCMKVFIDRPGDFSTYTLKLVGEDGRPLKGFDPRYAQIDFSFKANCPSEMDCAPASACYKEPPREPDIDYLAKDYASFRQLIFDRLSLVMPGWTERHVPDFGVALVELFAYVGDYLSYYQDAVATEAYLDTARLRVSVRRHALLVDYPMHEGCNARTWVTVNVSGDITLDQPHGFYFISDPGRSLPIDRPLMSDDLKGLVPTAYEVFEPIPALPERKPDHFYEAHNEIKLYTWHDTECCLPRGATAATLIDGWRPQTVDAIKQLSQQRQVRPAERKLRLKVGDVLILEEIRGPKTGNESDADKSHRHAVRLTSVEQDVDPLDDQPVVNVEWGAADALPFPLCISSIGEPPCCELIEDVSVARGNVVLADHGRTTGPEDLPTVPYSPGPLTVCEGPFEPSETIPGAGRFRPVLRFGPVTQAARFPSEPDVTRAQAFFLGNLIKRVARRVKQLQRQAEEGRVLTREEQIEVLTIFGRKALAQSGFAVAREGRPQPQQSAQEQAAALARLLARFDDHMAKKARRIEGLRNRALGGYTLDEDEREEIADLFGKTVAAEELELMDARSLGPASSAIGQQPRAALPAVSVCHVPSDDDEMRKHLGDERSCWEPRRSLLESGPRERHFVAEMDDEGRAHLRFGDGENGRSPDAGEQMRATYRIGNGPSGNIGADSIRYVVVRDKLEGVSMTARNPLPASGGTTPESITDVKALAPGAVRKDLQRAVIAQDYARLAERGRPDKVQRAAASLNWAGSWYEMRTHVDPRSTEVIAPALLSEVESSLYRYRRIGHDLATAGARFVPLDVEIQVCVLPHYLRAHVRTALLEVFSNRVLAGGRRGVFHPDNLTFGGSVFLSQLVAAAQSVEGVESVSVKRLQRLFEEAKDELDSGVLYIGPLEVARLDNDPNYPEHGQLVLDVRGGR